MSREPMPLYDPEDPRWESWRANQRRAQVEDAFYRAHYRYGERGVLTRYIIAPTGLQDARRAKRGKPPLRGFRAWMCAWGWTVGDVLLLAASLAGFYLWALLMWAAFAPISEL